MVQLNKSLHAWGRADFDSVFKGEIAQLGVDQLPLQQGLTASSIALDDDLEVLIINATEQPDHLHVKAGIFYKGIIAGCSCADDPTPIDLNTEYCVVNIDIDKASAHTTVTLLTE